MGTEKLIAFNEAWSAMAMQAFLEHQQWALSLWFPWARRKSRPGSASARILAEGLAPIRRRALANAKRLGRSKRK